MKVTRNSKLENNSEARFSDDTSEEECLLNPFIVISWPIVDHGHDCNVGQLDQSYVDDDSYLSLCVCM